MSASLHIPRNANQSDAQPVRMQGEEVDRATMSKCANWGYFERNFWLDYMVFDPVSPAVDSAVFEREC